MSYNNTQWELFQSDSMSAIWNVCICSEYDEIDKIVIDTLCS